MNTRRLVIGISVAVILLLVGAYVFIMHASKPIEVVKIYETPDARTDQQKGSMPLALSSPVAREKAAFEADVQRELDAIDLSVEQVDRQKDPFIEESESVEPEVAYYEQAEESEDTAYAAALNPPTAPTRGLINLLESLPDDTTYEEFEQRFTEYTLTYYPLTMLEPEGVDLLGPEAKAAYDKQKAASHKEAMDMIREDFASASPELLGMLTPDMRDLFEKEGVLP